jgi:zinc protease
MNYKFPDAVCLPLLLLILAFGAAAQTEPQTIPLHPAVKTGTLANGFTYYIQRNVEPEKRVQLYLVVKAGSVLEAENQRGLAHFLEHMAFNGTKHFPKHALIDYLQKNGVRFGADLNAYTSFTETVYKLPLPTDDPQILDNGFQILRDWAHDALLDQEDLDQERGVVIEEMRLGKGVKERIREQTLPVLLNHARYASRQPIGVESVLNNFTREQITSFYNDWYRPGLQALIVVGDIDVVATEQRIQKLFGDLKNPKRAKKHSKYNIPLTGKKQFLTVTDKEQPYTLLQLYYKHPGTAMRTTSDLRERIALSLFNSIVAERLGELTKQENPPFLQATSNIAPLFQNVNTLTAAVAARPGQLELGFKAMYTELVRIQRFGFTTGELTRAKARYNAAVEDAYRERDKIPSDAFVDGYVKHFLEGAASPGIAYQRTFAQQQLPGITTADLNAIVRRYLAGTDRDIVITAPEKEKATLPAEETVNRWITQVADATLESTKDESDALTLMTAPPDGGTVLSTTRDEAIGITELKLSNGVRLILKPTTFRNDEILIQGFSPGGTSLYNDATFPSASVAAMLVGASGAGPLSASQLPKFLSGKNARVMPFIDERQEGIQATTTKGDLETTLQLIYQYITAPRRDSVLFQSFMKRQESALASQTHLPESILNDTIASVLGNHHYRRTPFSLEKLHAIKLDDVFAVYKERFADASDFTFVVVGSVQNDSVQQLLVRYLGGLPATQRTEAAVDLGIRVPGGKISKKIYAGQEDKASVRLVFSGDHTYSQESNLQLDGLKEILLLRLTERLRETEGGVYSPAVEINYSKYPTQAYTVSVAFGCAPANVNKLINATRHEILKLQQMDANADDVQKYQAARKRTWQTMQYSNEFWYNFLTNVYQERESTHKVLTYEDALSNVTAGSIRKTAARYLNPDNMIEFVLLPEGAN